MDASERQTAVEAVSGAAILLMASRFVFISTLAYQLVVLIIEWNPYRLEGGSS
jgi:hypothetical protein